MPDAHQPYPYGLSRALDELRSTTRAQWRNGMLPHVRFDRWDTSYSPGPAEWGVTLESTLIVFTDGTDRAHRVAEDQMDQVLDEAGVNVFAIGLGGEISPAALQKLGRTGFVRAEQQANIGSAFDAVASSIESEARKFYLLSYCSPSRAGAHRLRVEVTAQGQSGAVSQEFDAAGFRPKCDPTRPPKFRVGRILLKE